MTVAETARYALLTFAWTMPYLGVWTLAAVAAALLLRRWPFVVLAMVAGAVMAWVDALVSVGASVAAGTLWDALGVSGSALLWRAEMLVGAAAGALQWFCALLAAFGWRSPPDDDLEHAPSGT